MFPPMPFCRNPVGQRCVVCPGYSSARSCSMSNGASDMRSIWRVAITAAASAAVVAGTLGAAYARDGHGDDKGGQANGRPYTIGLFGDMPYNAAGRVEYPNLIKDMNNAKIEFSIFDGDLKAG